ncbi:zinc finger domain-containing protein 24-like protein [Dinothrombium tinctorium]|uniref:Zinc finger domain-containing protein 24-like protein n=1 Tax=Dinothrombium tinctorium TaxID=1965070 RepID=A0A3S3QZA2_9ACAR|nr:zinc finger domain-containing protein 24-like protein [Dinothrombium tinctorium]RWS16218.1 zinc finger domain-containing protein 24-like protein [Dinothrombium tinctorium]
MMVTRGERDERELAEKAPLLDMLAEVASYTLNCQSNEVLTVQNIVDVESTEKHNDQQFSSTLTADQIRSLSEKHLLELFAEFTSDELKRYYRYTCCLQPDICKVYFESFASEEKARNAMKNHLLNHISDQSFPLITNRHRKRRRVEEVSPKRTKTKGSASFFAKNEQKTRRFCRSPSKRIASNLSKEVKTFDTKKKASKKKLKICRGVISEVGINSPHAKKQNMINRRLKKCSVFDDKLKNNDSKQLTDSVSSDEVSKNYSVIFLHPENLESNGNESVNYEVVSCEPSHSFHVISVNVPCSSADHSYTYVNGPKQSLTESEQLSLKGSSRSTNLLKQKTAIQTPAFPYVYEPLLPNVCEVVEVRTSESDCKDEMTGTSNHVSSKKVKEFNAVQASLKKQTLGKTPWERDLAIKCMEDLRNKRAESNSNEASVSRCEICNDKTFMSVNSLIYHYRSHAGIKPYECTICEATFTRQHSLNYHMLIHYNKTRFVCDECGRHFRHPSHFKEHMRRHTGETPYECIDCSVKFKTRNTYKRHLQTKHGKILTAKGIYEAPNVDNQPKKPCTPRRKYGLGYLHQNIEAIAQFEKAQKEFEEQERAAEGEITQPNIIVASNLNDTLDQLLQAAALTASDPKFVTKKEPGDSNDEF